MGWKERIKPVPSRPSTSKLKSRLDDDDEEEEEEEEEDFVAGADAESKVSRLKRPEEMWREN